MADGIVQVAPDSTGKKVDTSELSVGGNTVERQRIVVADPTGATNLAAVTANNELQVVVPDVSIAISIAAVNGTTQLALSGRKSAAVVLTGTWTGTIVFEMSIDGTNWVAVDAYNEVAEAWQSSTTSSGSWWFEPLGAVNSVRVRASAWTSGALTGTLMAGMADMNTPEFAGAPNTTPPNNAAQIGGTDGTNMRVLSVTTAGVLKTTQTYQTSNGSNTFNSQVTNSSVSVKASAGALYGYHIGNSNTGGVYVFIYDTASAGVTVGSTTPRLTLWIPGGGGAVVSWNPGIDFTTAISVAASTARNSSAAPATQIDVNLIFI